MSVCIHEPMNSSKISRKGCQIKIRYRKCKNCASRLPFSQRLCSPLFLKSTGKATKEEPGKTWTCYQHPVVGFTRRPSFCDAKINVKFLINRYFISKLSGRRNSNHNSPLFIISPNRKSAPTPTILGKVTRQFKHFGTPTYGR